MIDPYHLAYLGVIAVFFAITAVIAVASAAVFTVVGVAGAGVAAWNSWRNRQSRRQITLVHDNTDRKDAVSSVPISGSKPDEGAADIIHSPDNTTHQGAQVVIIAETHFRLSHGTRRPLVRKRKRRKRTKLH